MRAAALLLCASVGAASACVQDVTVALDASAREDGGVALDAFAPDAPAADADPVGAPDASADAGLADQGPTDTGIVEDSGVGPAPGLRWAEMVLPANTRELNTVWGRSATEVYAASGSGFVYRYDGTGDWTMFWRTNNNEGINAMTGDATHLYLAGDSTMWALDTTNMDVVTALRPQSRQMHGIAPYQNGPAMLIGLEEQTQGVLMRWTGGNTLSEVNRPIMVAAVHGVFAYAIDTYFFGGTASSIHAYQAGSIARELVDLPAEWGVVDRAGMTFRDFASVDGEVYAVGDRHMVFVRGGVASLPRWTEVYRGATEDTPLYAIAANGDEAYAVGDADSTGGIVRFDGADWRAVGVTDQWMFRDVWSARPDLYFAVGYRRNGIAGVIVRGTR